MSGTLRNSWQWAHVGYYPTGSTPIRNSWQWAHVAQDISGYTQPNLRNSFNHFAVLFEDNVARIRFNASNLNVAYNPYLSYIYPDEDISNSGNWGPTPIYSVIDENDGNLVYSQATPSNDTFEVGLVPIENYNIDNSLQIQYKFTKTNTSNVPSGGGDTIDLTVEVYDSDQQITGWTHNDISNNEAIINNTIDRAARTSIVNPSGLSIVVTANTSATGGLGLERSAAIDFIKLSSSQDQTGTPIVPPIGGNDYLFYIDQENVVKNGDIIINYQNVGGQKSIGWRSFTPSTQTSGVLLNQSNSISGYQIRNRDRERKYRFYKGDTKN